MRLNNVLKIIHARLEDGFKGQWTDVGSIGEFHRIDRCRGILSDVESPQKQRRVDEKRARMYEVTILVHDSMQ